MFHFVTKNPIFFSFSLCLLLLITAGIFFGGPLTVGGIHFILITLVLTLCGNNFIERTQNFVLSLLFFLLYLIFSETHLILLIGEIILVFLVTKENKNDESKGIFALLAFAFLVHLYYVQQTPVDIRQHDLRGIMYYISKITLHGINFFDFDPWQMYYLFHQPLHFIFAGHLYLAEFAIWNSNKLAQEGLQYLSLFYVTVSTIVTAGILSLLEYKGKVFYAALLLFVANPTLFLLSGYISDDTPVFLFGLAFLYFIILWHKTHCTKYIVFAALLFGFGVLTKLSILLLTPVVSLLFLYDFFKAKCSSRVIKDVSIFIIIAVPLSLFWIIRNHIMFDMQFYIFPDTSPLGLGFRYLTFFDRIGNFSGLYKPFMNAPYIVENNIWLALIKTELFGEWDYTRLQPLVYFPALILYFFNIVIKIICFLGAIFILIKATKNPKAFSIALYLFVLTYLFLWGYSFKYAMDYPYICSTDYRYFAILILPEVIILAKIFHSNKAATAFLCGAVVYAALSNFIYLLL